MEIIKQNDKFFREITVREHIKIVRERIDTLQSQNEYNKAQILELKAELAELKTLGEDVDSTIA